MSEPTGVAPASAPARRARRRADLGHHRQRHAQRRDRHAAGSCWPELLAAGGHPVVGREIVRDEPGAIRAALDAALARDGVRAVRPDRRHRRRSARRHARGRGAAPRPRDPRLRRALPRCSPTQEIGSAALLSRALGGIADGRVVFVLPGSRARDPARDGEAGAARARPPGRRGGEDAIAMQAAEGRSAASRRRADRTVQQGIPPSESALSRLRRSHRPCWLAAALLWSRSPRRAAETFVWVDEHGITHISNDPASVPRARARARTGRRCAALAVARAARSRPAPLAGRRRPSRPRRGAHAAPRSRRPSTTCSAARTRVRRRCSTGILREQPGRPEPHWYLALLDRHRGRYDSRRGAPDALPRHRRRRARALARIRRSGGCAALADERRLADRSAAGAGRTWPELASRTSASSSIPLSGAAAPGLREHRAALPRGGARGARAAPRHRARRADGRRASTAAPPTTRAHRDRFSFRTVGLLRRPHPRGVGRASRPASCGRCSSTSTPTRCSASAPAAIGPTG